MDWQWTMVCHDVWEWMKFNPNGTCIARWGSAPWIADVAAAKLLSGDEWVEEPVPGIEIWRATPELRQMIGGSLHPILQQKWVREDDGRPEWRNVPYCDMGGVTIV